MKTMLFSILVTGVCGVLAAAPTTQPAAQTAAKPGAPAQRVVVLPFEDMGDVNDHAWVGRAMQHSLAAEVARLGNMTPVIVEAPPGALNTAIARDTAKAVGGDIVVFGECQFSDASIRFTGEVVNLSTGQTMAGLKVSGNFRDLFAMEDAVGAQVRRALHPVPAITISGGAPAGQSAIFTEPAPSPDDSVVDAGNPNDLTDAYNRYYYGNVTYDFNPYGYAQGSDYGAEYPYGYGGYYGQQIIIVRHDRDRDHHEHDRVEGGHSAPGGRIAHGTVGAPQGGAMRTR